MTAEEIVRQLAADPEPVVTRAHVLEVFADALHELRNQAQIERCLHGASPRADEVIDVLEAVRGRVLGSVS